MTMAKSLTSPLLLLFLLGIAAPISSLGGSNSTQVSCKCTADVLSNGSVNLGGIAGDKGACDCICDNPVESSISADDRDKNLPIAFAMVTAAGLSTTIGAALVFFERHVSLTNPKILAASLGFSAGVMVYVSLAEIFVKSQLDFVDAYGGDEGRGYAMATLMFFLGISLTYGIDGCIYLLKRHAAKKGHGVAPECMHDDNTIASHGGPSLIGLAMSESSASDELEKKKNKELEKTGTITAIAIALHNFPEGLATFVAALDDPAVGAALAVAIAIHNIPEGLCVSIPIYYATGSRMKGFVLAFWSGVTEIIGALLGYLFLKNVMGKEAYAILFGVVAGMMVAISVKELLPTAFRFDQKDSVTCISAFLGMAVMALSLTLFTF